jgi:hypothetical protein
MNHPDLLRPLAALVLLAAAAVWVVGSHWTSPACSADVSAAVGRTGGSGTPAGQDVQCAAGPDDAETSSSAWPVATGALVAGALGLFGSAELVRRRRPRPAG